MYDSDYRVTGDGRTLVIFGSTGADDLGIQAIDLATQRDARKREDGHDIVDSLGGDWALLSDSGPVEVSRTGELWNIRTGAVLTFAGYLRVLALGVAPDGDVVRLVERRPSLANQGEATQACYDLAAGPGTSLPATVLAYRGGYCGTLNVQEATLSPDGTWAVVLTDEGDRGSVFSALWTADLHAGRWEPTVIPVGGVSQQLFWDSPTSFIAPYTDDGDHYRYERCSVDGRCHDLGIPGAYVLADVLGD
jgi:hypothetical protein